MPSSDKFATLFELLPIGAYRSSLDGRQLRANPALVRLNGFSSEAEMLAGVRDIAQEWYVEPDRRETFVTLIKSQGQVVDFVSEIYRYKTRERIWIREHAYLVRDAEGRDLYLEGTVEDISAQHKAKQNLVASQFMLSAVIQAIPDRVWLKAPDGRYLACNSAFAEYYGAPVDHIVGQRDTDYVSDERAATFAETDRLALQSGRAVIFDEDMLDLGRAEALPRTYEIIKAPVRPDEGAVIGVLGIARDVSVRREIEARLRETSEQLELALIAADLGLWVQDLSGTASYSLDARACAMLGLTVAQHKPLASWKDLIHPDDLANTKQAMDRHLQGETPAYQAEYRARHHHGHWVWLSSRGKVVKFDLAGKPLRMVGTLMDITERRQADETMRQLAFHDALTGLPNRRLLLDRLNQALAASPRSRQHGAVLYLDLDHFKHLNDTCGHEVGDMLLVQVAERIRQNVRAFDTVARMGGDEFVVLLEGLSEVADEAQAQTTLVGHKILAALNEPFDLDDFHHLTTPSIGASLFGQGEETARQILKQADQAMYRAKSVGRNTLWTHTHTAGGAR